MTHIIIIEGPQGTGKTTISNWLRENIPYSNLYRLSGHADKSADGKRKSIDMYDSLISYIESMCNCDTDMVMIFDRIFISEHVYCKLGYRDYDFSQNYDNYMQRLDNLDANVIILNLCLSDPSIYSDRLQGRKKSTHLGMQFMVDNSWSQQAMYYTVLHDAQTRYLNINMVDIITDDLDQVIEQLIDIFGDMIQTDKFNKTEVKHNMHIGTETK